MKKNSRTITVVSAAIFLGIVTLTGFAYLCSRTEPDAPKNTVNNNQLVLPVPTLIDESPVVIAEVAPENDNLKSALDTYLSLLKGKWSLYYEDLDSGDSFCCNHNISENTPMVAASLIKLFVMGAVYEQIMEGTISEEAVSEELTGMITVSDNDATNELIKLLGNGTAKEGMVLINEFATSIRCENTVLNRLMLENNGEQNYTSATECGAILKHIYEGQCVSGDFASKMLDLLLAQTKNNKIPAGLPQSLKCAHKTGELSGIAEGDAAIVFTESGDYILCVLSESSNNAEAIKHIAKIAEIVNAERKERQ